VRFSGSLAIETIPSASGVVTSGVTMSVSVAATTITVIDGIAFQSDAITIKTVKQAFLGVACLVADAVLKYVPTWLFAGCGVAVLPWIYTFTTVISVIAAKVGVAFFIASVISSLPATFV